MINMELKSTTTFTIVMTEEEVMSIGDFLYHLDFQTIPNRFIVLGKLYESIIKKHDLKPTKYPDLKLVEK